MPDWVWITLIFGPVLVLAGMGLVGEVRRYRRRKARRGYIIDAPDDKLRYQPTRVDEDFEFRWPR